MGSSPTVRSARRAAGYVGGYRPSQGPRPSIGQEGAGVLLALFLYPVLVNTITGGPAQGWKWVRAKWVNAGAPAQASPSSAPLPADPGTGTYTVNLNVPPTPTQGKAVLL